MGERWFLAASLEQVESGAEAEEEAAGSLGAGGGGGVSAASAAGGELAVRRSGPTEAAAHVACGRGHRGRRGGAQPKEEEQEELGDEHDETPMCREKCEREV